MHSTQRLLILLALAVCPMAAGPACWAASSYNVTLNTGPLAGSGGGPFTLDFQLLDGSGGGDANNTFLLSNFQLGGGSTLGAPSLSGGANGATATQVMLTDSSFFNEFTQSFTPGSRLSFDVQQTNNPDVGVTPDLFSFAILDGTGTEIPTLGPADVLLTASPAAPSPSVQTYGTDPSRTGLAIAAPTVSPVTAPPPPTVPEPPAAALLALGLLPLRALVRRRS